MLDSSLERLRGIEAKGPGLAAINAIAAAAVLIAISGALERLEHTR
jgi:hypothetical protein